MNKLMEKTPIARRHVDSQVVRMSDLHPGVQAVLLVHVTADYYHPLPLHIVADHIHTQLLE